eukprot:Protomagalhaensia_sp_Gyna_25__4967@NODE_53_length_6056_cov_78_686222_g40_i0_p2_GENE_NODE_53_length_6056_cov_78_686222_g40_i0NODE_53_length_6056_cov_78_686222_g40_i0_p2_ORF_typecomplete_len344_score38_32MIP/PF00230_20/5_6e29_NODE_53_length_6056_cov_78_686222_g40_i030804111
MVDRDSQRTSSNLPGGTRRGLWVTSAEENTGWVEQVSPPAASSFWEYSKFITPRSSMGEMATYNFSWYSQRSLSCVGLSEFLATGCLAYVVTMGIALPPLDLVTPLAIGGAIMCLSNIVGDYSGAHMNPCISIPIYLVERRFSLLRTVTYCIAETTGAIIGVQLGYWTGAHLKNPFSYHAHHNDNYTIWQILFCEALYTFLLAATALKAAFMKEEPNPFALFWIVGAVVAASYAGGPVSGACLNPALAVGFAIAGGEPFDLIPYVLGPSMGALTAVGIIMFFEPDVYARRTGLVEWKDRPAVPTSLIDRLAILERISHDEETHGTRSLVRGGSSARSAKRFMA